MVANELKFGNKFVLIIKNEFSLPWLEKDLSVYNLP